MSEFTSQWQRSSSGHKDTMDSPPGTLGLSLEAQELRQPMVWLCMPTTREGIFQGSRGKASGKHHVTKRPSHPVWSHNRNWKTTSHHIPACVPWSYHPPPSSLEERRGSGEHFGTEKSNLQLLGVPQPVWQDTKQKAASKQARHETGEREVAGEQEPASCRRCCLLPGTKTSPGPLPYLVNTTRRARLKVRWRNL